MSPTPSFYGHEHKNFAGIGDYTPKLKVNEIDIEPIQENHASELAKNQGGKLRSQIQAERRLR